jgi:hypothetical protein
MKINSHTGWISSWGPARGYVGLSRPGRPARTTGAVLSSARKSWVESRAGGLRSSVIASVHAASNLKQVRTYVTELDVRQKAIGRVANVVTDKTRVLVGGYDPGNVGLPSEDPQADLRPTSAATRA